MHGNLPLLLFLIVFAGALVGVFVYLQRLKVDPALKTGFDDVVLPALRSANPAFVIDSEFSKRPVYWVTESSTNRKVPVPKDVVAAGGVFRFLNCDLGSIPPARFYPHCTETICLEISNQQAALDAYYFKTPDRLDPMVDFFEQNVDPGLRMSAGDKQRRVERTRRVQRTRELIVSYFVEDGEGFVGYRERKLAAATQ